MKETTLLSCDGKSKLHLVLWEPEGEVKGIVQISHGMIEYIERYDTFARFLNKHGYVVIGNDHLGHGKTAINQDYLGYFSESEMSRMVVDDLKQVTDYICHLYPNQPCFLFGHSMGSFMARRYIMTYGNNLSGAILCGSGSQPKTLLVIASFMTKCMAKLKGVFHRSTLLKHLFFMGYDKQEKNDWLSQDKAVVDKYNQDPLCTYDFTINGYQTLLEVLTFIQNKKHIAKIPSKLPIFLIAGTDDPVGHYGKDIPNIYKTYTSLGLKDVTYKLYPKCRHELVNEVNQDEIFEDISMWLESKA